MGRRIQPRNGQSRAPRPLAWLKAEPKRCGGLVAEGPGGVFVFGTYEEDGPVTWEALTSPSDKTAYGEPYPNPPTVLRFAGARSKPAKKQDTRREVGRRQGEPESRPMDVRESEGCI